MSRTSRALVLVLVLALSSLASGRPVAAGEITVSPPRPPSPERRAAVEAWHRRWRAEFAPVERAAAALRHALGQGREGGGARECDALAHRLAAFDEGSALPAPLWSVDVHLKSVLEHLAGGALACTSGQHAAVGGHLAAARRAWAEAALALAPYEVTP